MWIALQWPLEVLTGEAAVVVGAHVGVEDGRAQRHARFVDRSHDWHQGTDIDRRDVTRRNLGLEDQLTDDIDEAPPPGSFGIVLRPAGPRHVDNLLTRRGRDDFARLGNERPFGPLGANIDTDQEAHLCAPPLQLSSTLTRRNHCTFAGEL